MPRYLASLVLALLVGTVAARVLLMRRRGIGAMHFGKLDRKDFLIPPLALLYFYAIFADAFNLPGAGRQLFFHSEVLAWLGVLACVAGWLLFVLSLVAFGSSFRVGIDADHPDRLVTSGVFARTRNPIYVAFWIVLLGQFLVFANWVPLGALGAATWLFHRQVLREEVYLQAHYGPEYAAYCARVPRYI